MYILPLCLGKYTCKTGDFGQQVTLTNGPIVQLATCTNVDWSYIPTCHLQNSQPVPCFTNPLTTISKYTCVSICTP